MDDLKMGEPAAAGPLNTGAALDYNANVLTTLRAPAEYGGQRLDRVLARLLPQHSRSRLQSWIREGRLTLGGVIVTESKYKLNGGEVIMVRARDDQPGASSMPEEIPLQIAYEDESLIVIDKPAGLVVHPGHGNWRGTLLNALLHHCSDLAAVARAGIVHRLDKDTSGLMVVAKTPESQTDLVRQLQARTVRRCYQALVCGVVQQAGIVDAPIGRHPTVRTKMAVVRQGKPARTHYRVLTRFAACTLLECALETGRTHQIRVHLSSLGHPVVGDPVYGGGGSSRVLRVPGFPRQALHASRLALRHPLTGEAMIWRSALPADMDALLDQLLLGATEGRAEVSDWSKGDAAGAPEAGKLRVGRVF